MTAARSLLAFLGDLLGSLFARAAYVVDEAIWCDEDDDGVSCQ